MKITFINHASFLLESNSASLLCDPWTGGKIFNDSWSLFSATPKVPYERVDYLFISHEHPDHFHLPTLRGMPEAERRRIVVLYQKHSSRRLVDAFRVLGFERVQELPLYRWITIRPDFDVLCGSVGSMDSFLAVRSEGECILNLNDCFCNARQIRYIQRLVGKVSILFTQFSFANWIGNRADDTNSAGKQLEGLAYQVATFRPDSTVPFASFVYFCNEENSWMNRFAVSPTRVSEMKLPGINFMYPGDEWNSHDRRFRSEDAVARYAKDCQNLVIDPRPPSLPLQTVCEAVVKLLKALRERFGRLMIARMEPFEIYLHDLDRTIAVVPKTCDCEIRPAISEYAGRARYVMCSQVAWYTFAHTWGWGTLAVSGMFLDREFEQKGEQNLFKRAVNALSTDLVGISDPARALRTVEFFWRKRYELLYRLLDKEFTGLPAPGAAAHVMDDPPASALPSS